MTKKGLQSEGGAVRGVIHSRPFEKFQPKATKCKCRYASDPETGVRESLLDQAKYFPDTDKPLVSVDRCIAVAIEKLWAAGVRTGACCCGHNGTRGLKRPHVMIIDPAHALTAHEALRDDPRDWWVSFWAGDKFSPHNSEHSE